PIGPRPSAPGSTGRGGLAAATCWVSRREAIVKAAADSRSRSRRSLTSGDERAASLRMDPPASPLACSLPGRLAHHSCFEPRTRSKLLTCYLLPLVESTSFPLWRTRTRRPTCPSRPLTALRRQANVGAPFLWDHARPTGGPE